MLYAFSFFGICHITYGAIIRLSTYYKVHSQIQLVSCCEGFPSRLKERFLHLITEKKCLLCIMPYFAPLWTSLDHLCIVLCTYRIYCNIISSLYFICNDFFHFYYLLSQLFCFFKCYFLLYIYILWFCILLSLRCFGSTLLYRAAFFPLFFLSFDVEISF